MISIPSTVKTSIQLTAILAFFILNFDCCSDPVNNENVVGHLILSVTYPEATHVNGDLQFIQVPGLGAETRIFSGDAKCLGYKDAAVGITYIGDSLVQASHVSWSNEQGIVSINDIPTGRYLLTLYARELYKYSEKYIEIKENDTLKLCKDFSAELSFSHGLEPWDFKIPTK